MYEFIYHIFSQRLIHDSHVLRDMLRENLSQRNTFLIGWVRRTREWSRLDSEKGACRGGVKFFIIGLESPEVVRLLSCVSSDMIFSG